MDYNDISQVILFFKDTGGPILTTTYNDSEITLEIGEFPAEPMFTVYIDGEVVHKSDWVPLCWKLEGGEWI